MEDVADCLGWATGNKCGECFVCHTVAVFHEVRRILRDDGTLWLNLGDTFDKGQTMVPARCALALKEDGWKLVQDIIWYSPNKMPESVTNRCTKSHEHIFLMANGNNHYFDRVAIQTNATPTKHTAQDKSRQAIGMNRKPSGNQVPGTKWYTGEKANKRDVWVVNIRGYSGLHFATFSPELITPCILAGTSEHGCCAECGKPYERVTESYNGRLVGWTNPIIPQTRTIGWQKCCDCATSEVNPCTVLDPFVGSGTTVAVSIHNGRSGIGIDLSEVYLMNNAIPRIEQVMLYSSMSATNHDRPLDGKWD
jgi:DNA modification methylase